MDRKQQLIAAFDAASQRTGLAPSTLGKEVGQGGSFYAGLVSGRQKRVWPETVEAVVAKLEAMEDRRK